MRAQFYYDNLDSTMAELLRLRAAGQSRNRFLVRCGTQSHGAGRDGNCWHSPSGGLWLSFDLAWPASVPSFALYIGRCAHQVLAELFPLPDLRLKWPNDIWLGDRKLGGILCSHKPSESVYLIGIGINTNVERDQALLEFNAAILSEYTGLSVSNALLAELICRRVERDAGLLATPGGYLDYCAARLYGVGLEAELAHAGGLAQGRIAGLAEDGSLLLDLQGSVSAFSQGSLKIFPNLA